MQFQFVNFHSRRKFGIELEFNQKITPANLVKIVKETDPKRPVEYSGHYTQDYSNSYWHVKFDRSCGDIKDQGGWEVASYVGKNYKDIECMELVTNALKGIGAEVNSDCGLHIHAEAADFNEDQMGVLVAYWLKMEPVILEMVPKHRRNYKYCKPLTKKINTTTKFDNASNFWAKVRPQGMGNTERRVTLNLCNYANHVNGKSTIELRLPEGTNEGNEVKNWLKFYLCLVDSLKRREMPKDLTPFGLKETLEFAGLHGESPFLILSVGLRATKMWFLKRILKYSEKPKLRMEAARLLENMQVVNQPICKIDFELAPRKSVSWEKAVS